MHFQTFSNILITRELGWTDTAEGRPTIDSGATVLGGPSSQAAKRFRTPVPHHFKRNFMRKKNKTGGVMTFDLRLSAWSSKQRGVGTKTRRPTEQGQARHSHTTANQPTAQEAKRRQKRGESLWVVPGAPTATCTESVFLHHTKKSPQNRLKA